MTNPGEGQWLTGWVENYGDKLVRYLWTYTHDAAIAQDLAQETFLRLYQESQRRPELEIKAGWLYTVARNLARDHLRHQKRSLSRSQAVAQSQTEDGDISVRLAVELMLDRLPESDRAVLLLFYYQDWTAEEIAAHYGRPAATVRSQLSRARDHFRRLWKEDEHEPKA